MKRAKRLKFRLVYQYKWSRGEVRMLRSEMWEEMQLAAKQKADKAEAQQKRLEGIRGEIASGSYAVPSEEVAQSLLRFLARQRAQKAAGAPGSAGSEEPGPNA